MESISYSLASAAAATSVSKWTIIDAIRDGEITAVIDGNNVRVDGDSLRVWLSGIDYRPGATLSEIARLGGAISRADDLRELQAERLAELV